MNPDRYIVTPGSSIYHVINLDSQDTVYSTAVCGMDIDRRIDTYYKNRPKGKRICKNCQRAKL